MNTRLDFYPTWVSSKGEEEGGYSEPQRRQEDSGRDAQANH